MITAEEIYRQYPINKDKAKTLPLIREAMLVEDPRWLLSQVMEYAGIVRGRNEKDIAYPPVWFRQKYYHQKRFEWMQHGNFTRQIQARAELMKVEKKIKALEHVGIRWRYGMSFLKANAREAYATLTTRQAQLKALLPE